MIRMDFTVHLYSVTANVRASPASVGSRRSDSIHLVADAVRGVEMRQKSLNVLRVPLHTCTSRRHSLPLGSWKGGSGKERAAHCPAFLFPSCCPSLGRQLTWGGAVGRSMVRFLGCSGYSLRTHPPSSYVQASSGSWKVRLLGAVSHRRNMLAFHSL